MCHAVKPKSSPIYRHNEVQEKWLSLSVCFLFSYLSCHFTAKPTHSYKFPAENCHAARLHPSLSLLPIQHHDYEQRSNKIGCDLNKSTFLHSVNSPDSIISPRSGLLMLCLLTEYDSEHVPPIKKTENKM